MNDYSTSPYMTLREALQHVAFISEAAPPARKFKVLVGPNLEPPIETQAIRGWLFAIPQIMNAGAAGDLHLKGYRPRSAILEDVPPDAFVDASLDPTTDRLEPDKPFPDSVTWTCLRFKREDVHELWPIKTEATPTPDAFPKIENEPLDSPMPNPKTKIERWYELSQKFQATEKDVQQKNIIFLISQEAPDGAKGWSEGNIKRRLNELPDGWYDPERAKKSGQK